MKCNADKNKTYAFFNFLYFLKFVLNIESIVKINAIIYII